jgi:5-methylcytosine-specific restriction protein A
MAVALVREPGKVYIAGPMRGKPEWNKEAFDAAELRFSKQGWHVFNPHKMGHAAGYQHDVTDGNCGKHLRHVFLQDAVTICNVDALAVLLGWENSSGATVEVALAQCLSIPIYCAVSMQRIEIPVKPWSTVPQREIGPIPMIDDRPEGFPLHFPDLEVYQTILRERQRSGSWPAVRKKHLEQDPKCRVCGSTKNLAVHHILPYHIAPAGELLADNLITLCEGPVVNCHFLYGHLRNWRSWNPRVVLEAQRWREALNRAKGNESVVPGQL